MWDIMRSVHSCTSRTDLFIGKRNPITQATVTLLALNSWDKWCPWVRRVPQNTPIKLKLVLINYILCSIKTVVKYCPYFSLCQLALSGYLTRTLTCHLVSRPCCSSHVVRCEYLLRTIQTQLWWQSSYSTLCACERECVCAHVCMCCFQTSVGSYRVLFSTFFKSGSE